MRLSHFWGNEKKLVKNPSVLGLCVVTLYCVWGMCDHAVLRLGYAAWLDQSLGQVICVHKRQPFANASEVFVAPSHLPKDIQKYKRPAKEQQSLLKTCKKYVKDMQKTFKRHAKYMRGLEKEESRYEVYKTKEDKMLTLRKGPCEYVQPDVSPRNTSWCRRYGTTESPRPCCLQSS